MRRGIEGQQELLDEHIAFVNGAFENLEEMLAREEQELERLDDEGLDEKFKDTLEEFLEEERSLIEQLKELKEDRMAKCRGWYDQMDEIFS